jgi:hypothetical protein
VLRSGSCAPKGRRSQLAFGKELEIRRTSSSVRRSSKRRSSVRENTDLLGELKPRYQSQVLQLPLSAFLRKHGHKSKKARLANCDEPGSLYNSSGTLLAVHVSRSVASLPYLGKGYPLFKTRLRAVLEQFCSDTAE